MQKKLEKYIVFIFAIILFINFSSISYKSSAAHQPDAGSVELVEDSLTYDNTLPKNFRKTTDLSLIKDNISIKLDGLSKLNISGSQQFSGHNLPILLKAIGTAMPVTVVDLRQESHGFINGYAASWANLKNNANAGLTREQVLKDEAEKLSSIKLNVPISFYNKPKLTIIPVKVKSENELLKSKGLSYIRVPVRDGGLPTDDIVDYFVGFVKSLPENNWLHFHCKEGIGRTTTFMIMYDMMKNYKVAEADEIIKRQLAFANFSDEAVKSFYNEERISFLKRFYDYCKQNGDSFKIKWSEWRKNSTFYISKALKNQYISDKNTSYIKNPIAPKFLHVITLDALSAAERTMVVSLQGLVSSRCSSQVYTLDSSQPDYITWLKELKNNYGVSYKYISDPWRLLNIYRKYVKGYILYSNKNSKDPSINNACSLASLKEAIVVEEALENKVRLAGISPILADCRNTGENWAFENLWDKGLNHSTVIQLSPDKSGPLRDYAIMSKSLTFYEDSIEKTALRDEIFSSMDGSSICLGWGPDEFINVGTASKCGVSVIAADWSYNLTTLSSFPSVPALKESHKEKADIGNFHYVTFIMSDGDNQQWYLGSNYNSPKWFGYPNRNKLSLGWSISPSCYYLTPTVFNLYNKSIISENVKNNFIVAPSGNGYMYPSKFKKDKLDGFIIRLGEYMENVNEKYVAVIDDSSFYNIGLWRKFTENPSINGIFYLDYHRHDKYKGEILWAKDKPIVACRDLLWNNLEDEDQLVNNINERVKAGQTGNQKPEAYTFVYVHAWSKDVSCIEKVEKRLKENPFVKIVTPDMFMELINQGAGGKR